MIATPELDLTIDRRLGNWNILEYQRVEAQRLLKAFSWKASLGPDFPPIACLVGGTGTGKSTLFNSLAGQKISEVGTRRPITLEAVIFVHEDALPELEKCSFLKGNNNRKAKIISHQHLESAELILVDTPDFDSVELVNRIIAENFFIITDLILFVTSQEKYGDLAGHEMSRKAQEWGKKIYFIINKVLSDEAFYDFKEMLKKLGYEDDPIRIERFQPPPELIPGLRHRSEFQYLFQTKETKQTRQNELVNLKKQTILALDRLEISLDTQLHRIAAVNEKVKSLLPPIETEMNRQLDAILTTDMENQIKDRLQKLLRKYDILFVPRMMVRNTLRQMFRLISDVFTFQGHSDTGSQDEEKNIRAENFEATKATARLKPLEFAVSKLNMDIAELLSSDTFSEDLRQVARDSVPRWGPGEIRKLYDETFPGIEHLLEIEFNKLREGLSKTDELKLYGSYTLWALLLVTAEIVVGGGFTILDALLNTVIVPFIPKWLVNLKVLDMLKEIGKRIDQAHRKVLRDILEKQAELYTSEFSGLLPGSNATQQIRLIKQRLSAY